MIQRPFNERRFRQQVDSALETVKKVLDGTRNPEYGYAADVDHAYDDKFGLAEFLTNSALAAVWNVLERLGLSLELEDGTTNSADENEETNDTNKIQKVIQWVNKDGRTVTLRFETKETCTFLKETSKEVKSPTNKEVITSTTTTTEEERMVGTAGTNTVHTKTTLDKTIVTTVKEYHWNCGVEFGLYVYVGSDPSSEVNRVILQTGRTDFVRISTAGKDQPPRRSVHTPKPLEVSLTWLLQNSPYVHVETNESTQKDEDRPSAASVIKYSFAIDRKSQSCYTPRCNDDTARAVAFFGSFRDWCHSVQHSIRELPSRFGCNTPASTASGAFVPVLPLFVRAKEKPFMAREDINRLLEEQGRCLDAEILRLSKVFRMSSDDTQQYHFPMSSSLASVALLTMHAHNISLHFLDGVDYIDFMVHTQLISAIGKVVKEIDFEEFLRFYTVRKLFRKEYAPEPFCYAIRRPGHYPDGTLSIQRDKDTVAKDDGPDLGPILTLTREISGSGTIYMPIDAATKVELTGKRFLHGWVLPAFDTHSSGKDKCLPGFNLVSRARQFSSFMLVLGKISGPESFQPEHAIILQNKDEVLLPLMLKQLPSPKEFKDAVKSLSPNQQRFATAFRSMQLESSVFGICVIQLKPQLEMLLGLPANALTKEIQLSESLLSLFIDYQVPSDLLSFDGDAEGGAAAASSSSVEKVATVKKHVLAVQEMIAQAKEKELTEAAQAADMRFAAAAGAQGDGSSGQYSRCWGEEEEAEEECADDDEGMDMFGSSGVMRQVFTPWQPPTNTADNNSLSIAGQEDESDLIGSDNTHDLAKSLDFTMIPKQLDAKFDALDDDSALRPTTISVGEKWKKQFQKSLVLTSTNTCTLGSDEQKQEKDRAFDLLDALSRSGSLPIASAELHVIVAATHSFDKSLMATVVQDNANPIDKIEKSLLIVASTIHGDIEVSNLLKDDAQVTRLTEHSPRLMMGRQNEFPGSGGPEVAVAGRRRGTKREHDVLTFGSESPVYECDDDGGDY